MHEDKMYKDGLGPVPLKVKTDLESLGYSVKKGVLWDENKKRQVSVGWVDDDLSTIVTLVVAMELPPSMEKFAIKVAVEDDTFFQQIVSSGGILDAKTQVMLKYESERTKRICGI